jgi:hypothetical protein
MYRFWAVRWLCIPYCSGIRVLFLIIKPTGCTNFSNLFLEGNSTCFRQFLCPSSGVFHCTHSNGIYHTACKQLSANRYDIYHCCVYSEKLLMMDRGTVKHVEFPSKNKFEKLVHLIGFIIRNLSQCMVT